MASNGQSSNDGTYRTIRSGGEWPPGFQIAVRHKGVEAAAEGLSKINGFEPVVLKVGAGLGGDPKPAGEYLLLPEEQAERWRLLGSECGDDPAKIVARLRDAATEA